MAPQQPLRLIPQLAIHDRFVQARMTDTLVTNLTDVDGIRKQHVERTTEKRVPARRSSILCDPYFGADAAAIQIFHQQPDGTEFQVSAKDF